MAQIRHLVVEAGAAPTIGRRAHMARGAGPKSLTRFRARTLRCQMRAEVPVKEAWAPRKLAG
jgi:hypothetical protein